MIPVRLVVSMIVPPAYHGSSQVRGAGFAVALGASGHDELVGTVRVIKQRLWRHVLASRGSPSPTAKETVRVLRNKF